MKIYHKEDIVTVTFIESPKHLYYKWFKMDLELEVFKEAHMVCLEILKEKGIQNIITDASTVTDLPREECIYWLEKELIPLLSDGSIKRLISVVPKSSQSKEGNKSWQSRVMGIDIYDVISLEEALKLIT